MDSRDYYEVAWQCRTNLLKQLAIDNDHNLKQTLQSLNKFESVHALRVLSTICIDKKTGEEYKVSEKAEFYERLDKKPPRPVSFNGLSLLWNGINRVDQATPQEIPAYILSGLINQKKYDCVFELGSGFARRLFETFYQTSKNSIRYFGGEITESGQKLATLLSEMETEINFSSFQYDHMNPNPPEIEGCQNVLLFTCHSIEQVPYLPDDFIKKLCDFAPKVTVVHFEPFGFQSRTNTVSSKNHQRVADREKYNQNLYALIEHSHQSELIELKWVSLNLFRLDKNNPTSVAIWEKRTDY